MLSKGSIQQKAEIRFGGQGSGSPGRVSGRLVLGWVLNCVIFLAAGAPVMALSSGVFDNRRAVEGARSAARTHVAQTNLAQAASVPTNSPQTTSVQASPGKKRVPHDIEALDEVALLQAYIRANTSNPPGNEAPGATFFARVFEQYGVDYRIIESAPGRANVWARITGGDEPGILLLHHMDVVPADAARWQHPPFAGIIADDYLHGRGSLDNKSAGIFHLTTFLELHAAGEPLRRDVVFLAVADEEAGGQLGVGWLLENRPQLFAGIGAVLNEGGRGERLASKIRFAVETTQKLPLWLAVEASGETGHGAVPKTETAPKRLLEALGRFNDLRFQPRLLPVTHQYLQAIAADLPEPWRTRFKEPKKLIASARQMAELHHYDERLFALLTNTCTVTRLTGSHKINVLPPKASAEIDCRLLPDEDPRRVEQLIAEKLLGEDEDEGVNIRRLLSFGPGHSPTDHWLYRALEGVLAQAYPKAAVLPKLNAGFTDSHFFRERGIAAYGFTPVILTREEGAGVHGENERISLINIKLGRSLTRAILREVVF